jgi:hypothetical protein
MITPAPISGEMIHAASLTWMSGQKAEYEQQNQRNTLDISKGSIYLA